MYVIISKAEPRGLQRGRGKTEDTITVTKVQLPQFNMHAPPAPGEETDYEVALQKKLNELTSQEGVQIVQVLWRPTSYE